jgi:phospholipid/cholesterol/gamma-HCH transport system substrate-binding protein
MKISSEVKIGITGIITVLVIIWGINYLKGRNVLSSNYMLIATYDQVDGLEPSAKVMMNGFKIGTVDNILFDTEAEVPFTLFLEIEKKYRIRQGSKAEIFSADLLGSKAVQISPSREGVFLEDGDAIYGDVAANMFSSLLDEASPLLVSIRAAVQTLDSTGTALNQILGDPAVRSMIGNLDRATGSLNKQLDATGDLAKTFENLKIISEGIGSQNESIKNTIASLESISAKLEHSDIDSLILSLNIVSSNLAGITSSMEQGKGTIGKLIYEDSLYRQLGQLISDLDSLVIDLNENPKKYVSFSLIGK